MKNIWLAIIFAGIVILPDEQILAIAVFVPHPTSPTELAEIVKSSQK